MVLTSYWRLTGCLIISGLVTSHSAVAAAVENAVADASTEPQLEEVIVTAQRREESVQKADLAVTAITGDTLQKMNITSGLDLPSVVPNLSVGEAGMGARTAIRGVVTNNDTEVGNPDVAVNIDGVYLGRQRAALSAIYDVERVEVLRGPQGTLYGRNATGGSINIITSAPDLTHAYGSGSLGYGNYSLMQTTGMYNLPITDTFAVRAAIQSDRHSGYVNSYPAPQNYEDEDAISGRMSALWKPWDAFSAQFVYEQSHSGGVGGGGFAGGGPLGIYQSGSGSGPYRWSVPPYDLFQDDSIKSSTLLLNYHGFVDIAYVGNYRSDHWFVSGAQAAQGPQSVLCQTAVAVPDSDATNCTGTEVKQLEHQKSHELRFSKDTDSIKAVVGFYYYKEDNDVFNGLDPAPGGPPPAYDKEFAFEFPDVEEDSKAAFGQATWAPIERLRLTAGARYTKDHKYREGNFYLSAPAGSIVDFSCPTCGATAIATIPSYANLDWSKVTWKGAVDFDLTPDSMIFASVSTGYKAGGYGDGVQPNNNPFNPETLTNYELGWKNQFFNRRVQVNIDVFHTLFNNYQATSGYTDPVTGTVSAVTVNAGKAQIDGVELESTWLVTQDDKIGFNATYLNARFTQFNLPDGDQFILGGPCATCGYSLTGNKLPYAPDVTARLEWDHTFPLPNGNSLVSRLATQYSGNYELEYHDFPVTHQTAYTRSDFSLSYEVGKTWSLMAWVKNIENTAVLISAQPDNNAPNGDFANAGKSAFWMAPRTFGVKLTANF